MMSVTIDPLSRPGGPAATVTASQAAAITLSVVIPVYNEETGLAELHKRLTAVLELAPTKAHACCAGWPIPTQGCWCWA